MTNEQILRKAIEKAEKNGYKNPGYWIPEEVSYEKIIFSHDFAKCFWGEEKKKVIADISWDKVDKKPHEIRRIEIPAWKYHLPRIVLEKEPLKYLAQFLKV